jgi:hypothetical protein
MPRSISTRLAKYVRALRNAGRRMRTPEIIVAGEPRRSVGLAAPATAPAGSASISAVTRLSRTMTIEQFHNGYWYATELKAFADELGIPRASQLRKNELEPAILHVLRTGKVARVARGRPTIEGTRDVERGLTLDLRVVVYTNDKETKDFLEREAARMDHRYKRRSGARYRINRWREDKLAAGKRITYRDLIAEYVRLSVDDEPFEKIASGRYINFLAAYLANEQGATHAGARTAWKQLKALDVPKDYASWRTHLRRTRRGDAKRSSVGGSATG